MTLPELAIKRHVTTLMILVSMAVLGGVSIVKLPLAFLPDMEEPELFIRLPYPNASPEQILHMIVRPVEDSLGAVKGLESMWSRCDDDGATIRLEFDWEVNLHLARVEIWEKIDRARSELPEDMEDITVGDHWNNRETDDPVLEIRLSSGLDLSRNYDLLDRKIVKPLQRVPGVAQVRLDGINPREIRINLRKTDLELHGVDVRDVTNVLENSNFNQSLGKITEGDTRYALRTIGAFLTVDEIRNLVIRSDGLRISNLAEVVYEEPKLEFGRHLDGNFAIGLTVSAESKANVVEVCDALESRILSFKSDPDLQGLKFLTWMNQGHEIKNTLLELFYTGIFGALLACIVLFLFLRRISTTVVSVICIPLSLIAACGVLWLMGKTLNTLSLLGLIVGIGMLVDNAVVVIENIFRHQEKGYSRQESARLGAREVSTAVIAATLTSVIVFLPIIFNKPSEMNIKLQEIGIAVCLTLLASLLISQTLIPLATSWFIRVKRKPRERWVVWLENRYTKALIFNLKHRWLTPVILLLIATSAIYPWQFVDLNFDSSRPELYAQIRYDFSEDLPLEKKEEFISRVEGMIDPHRRELLAKAIYSWWSDGFSMTRVYFLDGEANEENLTMVHRRLREILPDFPGVTLEIGVSRKSWRRDRGKRVALRIHGEDMKTLAELAEEARLRIDGIEGLFESFASTREGQQELHVELNRDLASRYGISGAQIARTIGLTYRGRRLQRFRTPDGEREVRMTLDEQDTESVSQLHNLPLFRQGDTVPLASIADFKVVQGSERIERDDRMTSVWVGAKYSEGTKEFYIPKVVAALETMPFPFGYSWSFGKWQSRRQRQSMEFGINLLLALMLIFAVMASLFESVQQAIALMIALPFALAGAIWVLFLTGNDFDEPAAVGVLLLIGIVVNNGIVMIEHVNHYRRKGMSRRYAFIKGGKERLRPILMTALTTLIGLVPIVVQRPALGGLYYYTMALVLMGGLTVSTFLTTLLLPTTTTLVEDGIAWIGLRVRGVFRQ